MKEKLMRFMIGRYGVDAFSKCMMWTAIILMLVSMFTRWNFLYLIALLLIVYIYFRMFSKNVYKRAAENQKFLGMTARVRGFWSKEKRTMEDKRTHRIYKCPNCGQKIRVPKGKGKIAVTCPKCHIEFVKKS